MSEHLSDAQLGGLIEDRLSVDEADWVERHLETCERCLQRLSTLNDAALRALDPRARDDGERHPDYDSRLERRITRAIDAGTVEPPVGEAEVTTRLKFARFVDRGGLGQVFEYTDCEFQRPVAIKLLRAELANRPAAVARFRREMEIAATIDTPGCPAVYGSGRTPGGHLFYWMQLVTGPTLTQEIAAFHASPSPDLSRSSTSFRRLLGLFRGICATLAIAHERGILHRDLKPDNVRVHRDGHPIVLDWGLAKVETRQDETHAEEFEVEPFLSHQGMTIGTPEYMAPEQAAGDVALISKRADIYGLGGILHEILTGKPPHEELRRDQATVATLIDAVACGHLPALPAVPGELRSIAHRALAISPDERYADAQELAAEIDRWLAGQPVAAHRYGIAERSALEIRRRPLSFLAAATALLVIVLAAAVSWRYQMRAKIEQTQAAQQRAIAGRRFDVALDAQLALVTAVQEELGEIGNTSAARRLLLSRAETGLNQLVKEAEGKPGAELAAFQARLELAHLLRITDGKPQEAKQEYRRLQEEMRRLPLSLDEDQSRRNRLIGEAIHGEYLTTLAVSGPDEAKVVAATLLGIAETNQQSSPRDAEPQLLVAKAHMALGRLAELHGRDGAEEAIRHYDLIRSAIERLPETEASKPEFGSALLDALAGLARAKAQQRKYSEAIPLQESIVARLKESRLRNPRVKLRRDLIDYQMNLGVYYKLVKQIESSISVLEAARVEAEKLVVDHPDVEIHHRKLRNVLFNLSLSYRDHGDVAHALKILNEQVVPFEKLDLANDKYESLVDQAITYTAMANTLQIAKRTKEACGKFANVAEIRLGLAQRNAEDEDNLNELLVAVQRYIETAVAPRDAARAVALADRMLAELDGQKQFDRRGPALRQTMASTYYYRNKKLHDLTPAGDRSQFVKIRDGWLRIRELFASLRNILPETIAEVEMNIVKFNKLLNE